MLREENRLMRSGQVEKAGALAKRIGRCYIVKLNEHRLKRDDGTIDAKDMWDAVRHVTGRKDKAVEIEGINAETLNRHYASISTDPHYESPSAKQSVSPASTTYVTEWQVFKALERRRPTATGLDSLPSWFLELGAPIFSKPLAQLFNMSIASSTVPEQWKQAYIKPVPKVTHPKALADVRPISITPVLTRLLWTV